VQTATVQTVREPDQDRAVSTLVMAFSVDPICRWVWPDSHQYLSTFPEFVRRFGGDAFEHDAAHAAGELFGVAMWHPPGVHADDEAVGELVQESVFAADLERVFDFFGQLEQYHPQEEIWYLPLIGVDPKHQGQGHGGALLAHALAQADADGKKAYLEASSEGSRRLYERHGFEVTGTIQAADSPPLWPMLREPR